RSAVPESKWRADEAGMSWPIKFGPTDLAAAQRIEQRRQAVMIDFLHQRQQLADVARREADPGEPVEIVARKIGNQAPLILSVGHRLGPQALEVVMRHGGRIRFIRGG